MKKQIPVLFIIGAYLLAGCASKEPYTHEHEHESEHLHEHVHDHEHQHEHEREGHDHEHEGGISLKPGEAEAIGLVTEEVQPGAFESVIRCTGTIIGASGDVVTVVAPQSGTVHYARSWAEGAPVVAGATLFTLSSRNVGEGDAVERARIAFEVAKADYDRASALVKDKIVSQREYEQALERYEQARLAYEAVGRGQSAGSPAKAAKGGYIARLWAGEGEYVDAGAPLATIAQNRRLQLRAEVPQRYYAMLPTVSSANFVTPYDDALYRLSELNGRLLSYGRNAGDASFYVPVTFDFDNRAAILPGTGVEVFLLGKPRTDVITLPLEAITEEQGLFFVYRRLCENSFEKVEVKTGADDGSRIEILSGVNPGDKVVTHGVYRVKLAANSGVIPEGHSHNH